MNKEKPRILALFGARVVFGEERANIEVLSALQKRGCDVLCVVRPEQWPELLDIRRRLDDAGLKYTAVFYMDYPLRGWIVRTLLSNPSRYISGQIAIQKL